MRLFNLAVLAGLALATSAFAVPPTEAEIQAQIAAAMEYYQSKGPDFSLEDPGFHAVLDAQLEGVDPDECDMATVAGMQMLWAYTPNAKDAWMARIETLGQGEDWLDAALMLANMGEVDKGLAIGQANGGLPAVPDERLAEVMGTLSTVVPDEQLAMMQMDLVGLADRMPEGSVALLAWAEYPRMLESAGVDAETRKKIRGRIVDGLKAGLDQVPDGRPKAQVEGVIAFFDSAAGRGELIGFPSPAMDFTWNSEGEDWSSIESLKGKVVVVDFWATWCGPCVASFPDVAELVEYFDGYDVVFLGVTSPQKRVIFGGERGVVNAADFAEECSLMKEYMAAKEMTWPVVMTKQNVFHPEFGVRGIPHVAIIGADGKVAYNGLHPAGEKAAKIDKINGLLKKAGLKHPPSLAETEANRDA